MTEKQASIVISSDMTAGEHPRVVVLSAMPDKHRAFRDFFGPGILESAFTPLDLIQLLLDREFDVAIVDSALPTRCCRLAGYAQAIQPWLQWIAVGGPPKSGHASPGFLSVNPCVSLSEHWSSEELISRLNEAMLRKKLAMRNAMPLPLSRIMFFLEKFQTFFKTMLDAGGNSQVANYLHATIGQLAAWDVSGALNLSEDQPRLSLKACRPAQPSLLRAVENEMFSCCEILSASPPDRKAVAVETEGDVSPDGADEGIGSFLIIPLVNVRQLQGVLAFAAVKQGVYGGAEASYLSHFSNYLVRMFPSLRQVQMRAVRDELTGLFNRRYFTEELARAWELGRRYHYPVGLLMLDLDAFKSLNDVYGHMIGDAVLREFSRILESVARRTDILARYGGDEFAVILPNSNTEQTGAFGERLMNAVNEHLFCADRYPLQIGVSVGVASSAQQGIAVENDLISLADRALYLSKETGKGKISTAEHVLDRETEKSPPDGAPVPASPKAPAMQGQVLVIDDEEPICRMFEQILTMKGFKVMTETNPRKALELIASMSGQIDLALIDLKMPEMSGIEVLEAIRRMASDIISIVITGFVSVDNTVAALRAGAYDFIQKPVNFDELVFAIQRGVEHCRLLRQLEGYRRQLEETLDERNRSLRDALNALEESYMATMGALSAALKVHEPGTGEHDFRVAEYAVFMARHMRFGEEQLIKIRRGALLHDIGKIGIPDAILQKAGSLTDAEMQVMRQHPVIGYNIVKRMPFLQDEAEMVYQHHERYDGTGYPLGLAGRDISIGARLFAVVDSFDALCSDRVYRKAVSAEEAAAEIRLGTGTQFDPEIVEVFLSCYREMARLGVLSGRNRAEEYG